MEYRYSILNAGPNGHVAVAHLAPHEMMDEHCAAWRLCVMRQLLGGMDVVVRARMEDGSVIVDGDPQLREYGHDPRIDSLRVFVLQSGHPAAA